VTPTTRPGTMRLSRFALQRVTVIFALSHLVRAGLIVFLIVQAFRTDLPVVGWALIVALPVYLFFVMRSLGTLLKTYRNAPGAPPAGIREKKASRR